MLFTKAVVIAYMLSGRDYEFLKWKDSQEYIRTQRVSPVASDSRLPTENC